MSTPLLGPDGKPVVRAAVSSDCPHCKAPIGRRRVVNGFGEPQVCCGTCGYDFPPGTPVPKEAA
jgi:hypothetical protein